MAEKKKHVAKENTDRVTEEVSRSTQGGRVEVAERLYRPSTSRTTPTNDAVTSCDIDPVKSTESVAEFMILKEVEDEKEVKEEKKLEQEEEEERRSKCQEGKESSSGDTHDNMDPENMEIRPSNEDQPDSGDAHYNSSAFTSEESPEEKLQPSLSKESFSEREMEATYESTVSSDNAEAQNVNFRGKVELKRTESLTTNPTESDCEDSDEQKVQKQRRFEYVGLLRIFYMPGYFFVTLYNVSRRWQRRLFSMFYRHEEIGDCPSIRWHWPVAVVGSFLIVPMALTGTYHLLRILAPRFQSSRNEAFRSVDSG